MRPATCSGKRRRQRRRRTGWNRLPARALGHGLLHVEGVRAAQSSEAGEFRLRSFTEQTYQTSPKAVSREFQAGGLCPRRRPPSQVIRFSLTGDLPPKNVAVYGTSHWLTWRTPNEPTTGDNVEDAPELTCFCRVSLIRRTKSRRSKPAA